MTSAYLDWKAGDRVVCVKGWSPSTGYGYGDEAGPIAGEVYTIREIGMVLPPPFNEIRVRLCEIVNEVRPYFGCGTIEPAFYVARFRKVVTRPTSIAFFEALLNPIDSEIFRELEAEEFDYQDCTSILSNSVPASSQALTDKPGSILPPLSGTNSAVTL